MKVFAERKIKAKGLLLPKSEFKLFREIDTSAPDPARIAAVIADAERYLNDPIPDLPLSLYREFVKNGNRSNFENKFFFRRERMVKLAVAEGYEKKGRFTEKLADFVWAILEESTWMVPAHLYNNPYNRGDGTPPVIGEDMLHGIDIFAATTASALTITYLNAKEALDGISETICKKIEHMINERIVKPFLQCPFWWTGEQGGAVNNWGPWICSNLLMTVGTFTEDMNIRERVVDRCLNILDNFINGYAPDGGCDEGPNYWGGAGAALFACLEALEDLSGGRINVYDCELIRNIGDYIFKVNINGNSFVNFADCPPKSNHSPSMLMRFGKKCGSPFLESFGKMMARYGDGSVDYWHGYNGLKRLYVTLPEAVECPMPEFTALPDLGVITARDGSDSSKGMFLAAKSGHNAESHNHNDVGNFIVYYDAKPVIIDVGVGAYTQQTFSSRRYELWFMQSGYHNLPSFGGVDQHDGRRFAGRILELDEERKLLSSDLTAAYPAEAGLESFVRTVRLDGSAVVLKDEFRRKAGAEGDTVFHLMTCVKPELLSEGKIALAEGRTLTYDPAFTAKIEQFDPTGLNAKGAWGTEVLWRICLSTSSAEGELNITVE